MTNATPPTPDTTASTSPRPGSHKATQPTGTGPTADPAAGPIVVPVMGTGAGKEIDELASANASIAKSLHSLTRPVRALVNQPYILVVSIFAIIAACSAAYAVVEDKGPIESLWWAVVTGSTVGYGDFYPETTTGRGIATLLIVAMLILIPIAIGHVIANLVSDRNQFTHAEQIALAKTIESLHDRADRTDYLMRAFLAEERGQAWVDEQIAAFEAAEAAHHDVDDQMLELLCADEA